MAETLFAIDADYPAALAKVQKAMDFVHARQADTMRVVVPGVTLAVLGYQTVLACFFISLLGMRRR